MKNQDEVEKRISKLRKRYRLRYVQERTGRHYLNCVHNYRHVENQLPYSRGEARGAAPERLTTPVKHTLRVLQEQAIHICMYGSKTDPEWNGDVCDELDKRAPECPWFKPARSEDEVGLEFDEAMSDVEFVFENYKDVAALQWVLDIRDWSDIPDETEAPPSLWQRFLDWFRGPAPAQLPPALDEEPEEPVTEPKPDVPKGLWDADSQDSPP